MTDAPDPAVRERLRALPAVDQLAAAVTGPAATPVEATAAARAVLDARRDELLAGADGPEPDLVARARAHLRPSLRRVLNGTGVVIHTNLGRAPLAGAAADAVADAAHGYMNLELDLATGRRGARDAHVAQLLVELTGAQDAMVVNNGAAATLLAAAALAGPGRSIVVSRGQLVEIGGGFRVPDVVAQAGAQLVEVGTTNRTRAADFRAALDAGADVVLRVHQSNFRTVGFVEDVPIAELTALGAPVIDDLGSGVLAGGLDDVLADEPPVRTSVAAGAALVCFSGDKLLGGPQAGILVGTREAITTCRRHPLARALRVGRLPLAALAATLALYRDPERARADIPVLAMLTAAPDALLARARQLAGATGGDVVDAVARAGGGALPLLELHGPAVAVGPDGAGAHDLAARLRAHDPPLLARITDGRVTVDPRTLHGDGELEQAAAAISAALSGS
ncbi:MAG TPA: L-seryl-tRNA(Sec) selenium transferase [Baekduia sp.]|uniref:L-seryl-tRNA(Sec) selenium transferase n=1 Tax=Baekduia sp. TaxID=2600305 RepID=UPI002C9623AC|nr:L-seryl-tRNA(Sec) selenium transferase [Baekduia sp.]HMJ37009.1 L-seryl-tRNA(Sec) selenium transferase [Baekduia sp.]